ncbi:MAG: ABC transporter permease [Solirubrobacteraceae bacterium]|nr:ABC transporter permease [Solirubrobacteraceae bacterium]
MTALTLRGIASRKLRTALTSIAIILGVAMISGTFVLTDTINKSFDDIFQTGSAGIDVAVTPRTIEGLEGDDGSTGAEPLPQSLVERVAAVPGVAAAEGSIQGQASIRDKNGDAITTGGAPNFVQSIGDDRFTAFRVTEGRKPARPGEVAIDAKTAEDHDFPVGSKVPIVTEDGKREYDVVGIVKFGDLDSLAGAAFALMPLAEAQRATNQVGQISEVDVAAEDGVSPQELKGRVATALRGAPVTVRTGQESADKQSQDLQDNLGFLRTALLVFGGIAVFVGAFVIYNTFSITVAQRTRELALLRTLGASRRQVLGSVALEAFLIGLVASIIGLIGGLLLAPGLTSLFSAFGFDLPTGGSVIKARTIIIGLLVGTVVTVVASIAPALRATRIAPIAAMREGLTGQEGRQRRPYFATVLLVVGIGLLLFGLFGGGSGGQAATLLGLGAAVVFLAVALLSPRLVRPLAAAIGAPLQRVFGFTGRLARENSTRNPARTAVTAAALMIGVALVAFVSIFAAGLQGSVEASVDRAFSGDLTIMSKDGFSPVPAGVQGEVADVPGVGETTAFRFSKSKVTGVSGTPSVVGIDPSAAKTYDAEWKEGNNAVLAALGRDGTVVDSGSSVGKGRKVGDQLRVLTPTGRRVTLTVRGLVDEGDFGVLGGGLVVSTQTIRSAFGVKQPAMVFVAFDKSRPPAATRTAIDRLLASRFPNTEAQTREELKESQADQIGQILGLIYALLALSVIVSLFGIVNTLALSVFERTRELGMLRAIGTSRRQVRRIVRLEAVITSLIGATLGVVLGVLFALLVSRPLEEDGFVLTFPIGALITLLVLSALAGVVAAILPARRASKLDVLEALAYE